jgi:acyl carrier protein
MELKDFIVNFAEQFDDVENVELTADTRFRDIEGYTSLVALMIITMVDEEYNVTISGDDIRSVNTIGELYNLVESRL